MQRSSKEKLPSGRVPRTVPYRTVSRTIIMLIIICMRTANWWAGPRNAVCDLVPTSHRLAAWSWVGLEQRWTWIHIPLVT